MPMDIFLPSVCMSATYVAVVGTGAGAGPGDPPEQAERIAMVPTANRVTSRVRRSVLMPVMLRLNLRPCLKIAGRSRGDPELDQAKVDTANGVGDPDSRMVTARMSDFG